MGNGGEVLEGEISHPIPRKDPSSSCWQSPDPAPLQKPLWFQTLIGLNFLLQGLGDQWKLCSLLTTALVRRVVFVVVVVLGYSWCLLGFTPDSVLGEHSWRTQGTIGDAED